MLTNLIFQSREFDLACLDLQGTRDSKRLRKSLKNKVNHRKNSENIKRKTP